MNRMDLGMSAAVLYLFCAGLTLGEEGVYNIRDYGAKGDGRTPCTKAVQKAIDECSSDGGGTVHFPPGAYVSGTIHLKSDVTLRLDAGCRLSGSKNLEDYPSTVQAVRSYTDNYTDKSLIYAEKAERIAITGRGTIDGQGAAFKGPYKERPYMIRLVECRGVTVKDVTIVNSPMWVQHYLACEDVRITGITVRSHANANNDGIDIDCCRRVIISDCSVDSGDDAIVLKSTSSLVCRDVTVSNCVLRSYCNALKMGTESNGGFENIVLSGCAIYDTSLAGVALEIVDGGTMDRVIVSNITMDRVGAPIFIRLGNRARPFKKDMDPPGIGALRNVTISNVEARGAGPTGCAVSGIPDASIENVTLSNLSLSFEGGQANEQADRAVPERPEAYPEYSMFGRLPAYGLYCRHVKGLRLSNVQLQSAKGDGRHALVCEDVEDLSVEGLDAHSGPGASAMIRLTDIQGAFIRGCRPKKGTTVFLEVQGRQSSGILLACNDFSAAGKVVERGDDVPEAALCETANRMK